MRRARSDPVLIKPSATDFMLKWNEQKPEPSFYDRDADPLYGILIRISEVDLLGVSKDIPPNESYRIGQRIERQQRRRNSVIQANKVIAGADQEGLKRINSAPDILEVYSPLGNGQKRVSFSIEQILPPTYNTDMTPNSPATRPILTKKKPDVTLPLTHMDYDMFTAWRRGSRLSVDLQTHKIQQFVEQLPQQEPEWKARGPVELLKGALFNCFSRRHRKTTPVGKY